MASNDDEVGATPNERLLAAAKSDNDDLLLDVLSKGGFDINYADGIGNTALHYAASKGSVNVLDLILYEEGCDVDPINRLEKATPLHLAAKFPDPDVRYDMVSNLLGAGADTKIKDKWGSLAVDYVPTDDEATLDALQIAQTGGIPKEDVVYDYDEPDSDDIASDEE